MPPSITEAIGWIRKTLKIPEKTIESQKAIEPLPETVWTKASIGLYSDPEGRQAVALIGQKSKLTVLAEQGEWCKVETEDHKIGWIRKNQVSW
jgi:SH3-like domain-containing protein